MPQICVPLANGFEEIEAISIIDICRRGEIEVIVAGVEGETILGAHNIPVVTDCLIDEVNANQLEMIILPGGWVGTQTLAENTQVQSLLQQMQQAQKRIGAICAAPYALEAAGVLGSQFTCYPSIAEKIQNSGYRPDQAVVSDNKVMTSQGVGTAICFALEVVRVLQGEVTYQKLKGAILAKC